MRMIAFFSLFAGIFMAAGATALIAGMGLQFYDAAYLGAGLTALGLALWAWVSNSLIPELIQSQ